MKDGICKRDKETGLVEQLYDQLSFADAFSKVMELRSKRDGNMYWIGHAENHKLMK